MKKLLLTFAGLSTLLSAQAQSKVFKSVGKEMRSQIRAITQDESLVGYLQLLRLEKISRDSFSYKLQIMDENLNDIGSVQFADQYLDLQDVAFEQDVLCLGYLRWDKQGMKPEPKHAIFAQFLSLDGKLMNTATVPNVKIELPAIAHKAIIIPVANADFHPYVLKHHIQIHNLPEKGFALLYGDDNKTQLTVYNTQGERQWSKRPDKAEGYLLNADQDHIYLLSKKEDKKYLDAGFEMNVYTSLDSNAGKHYALKDPKGNPLKVLSFGSHPQNHTPFVSGMVINSKVRRVHSYMSVKDIAKGHFAGVFNIDMNGEDKKETFSYWHDGSKAPGISKRGYYSNNHSYTYYATSLRDFEGNTYFVGSEVSRKPRWGSIATGVVLTPVLFFGPILVGFTGVHKYRLEDAVVLKQSTDGKITLAAGMDSRHSGAYPGRMPLGMMGKAKSYYQVTNPNTQSSYLVMDDSKDIRIYNVGKQKVERTIAHRDGNIQTDIYPAKEGHIMVAEHDRNDGSTRMSIEAL